MNLFLDMRLSKAKEEYSPLWSIADSVLRSAQRFGFSAERQGLVLRAVPLSQANSSSQPASQGLFGLVLLSTAAFGSSTIAELVYRKVNFRPSQDLLTFFFFFLQTWYADKLYSEEIKKIYSF